MPIKMTVIFCFVGYLKKFHISLLYPNIKYPNKIFSQVISILYFFDFEILQISLISIIWHKC